MKGQQTHAQGENNLRKIIKDLYEKDDKQTVIDRTMIAVEMGLNCGLNSGFMCKQMIDLGVRFEDLGIGMMKAILKVDDKKLNEKDKIVKKEAIRIYGNILVDVAKQVIKEKKK